MTRTRWGRRSLCSLALIALLLPSTAGGREAAADPTNPSTEFSMLQLNLCGLHCHSGQTWIADPVSKLIRDKRPTFVSFNEACRSQVQQISLALRALGLTYHWMHDETDLDITACDFGNAVMWSGSVAPAPAGGLISRLPPDPAEERRLMCYFLQNVVLPQIALCSTHITPNANYRSQQIQAVADGLEHHARFGMRVVLGADFNVGPGHLHMADMYLPTYPGGLGSHHEVENCRCGYPTFGLAKLDYVFTSPHFAPNGATVGTTSASDHKWLLGRFLGGAA